MKKIESIKKDLFKKLKSIELFKNNEINNLENIRGGIYYWADGSTMTPNPFGPAEMQCEEPGVLGPGVTMPGDPLHPGSRGDVKTDG